MKKLLIALILSIFLVVALFPVTAFATVNDNNPDHTWNPTPNHVDIMLIGCHPDDDQLYLGGVGPIYTDAGKTVITVIVTPGTKAATPKREQEELNGRWLVGDRIQPEFGPFIGSYSKKWSDAKLQAYLVTMFRKYTPSVVVTQDIKGEYGHKAHKWMVKNVLKAFELSGNAYAYPVDKYGDIWNPLKLYVHLYNKNKISLDMKKPLSSFDGKTAMELGKAGFLCHKSQQNGNHHMGEYHPESFGLYKSLVGYSTSTNDMFQDINLENLLKYNSISQVAKTREFQDYLKEHNGWSYFDYYGAP